ncbi:hypothetical protein BDE02_07G087200 [Populus trichocarpa]|nr:hypothetical protein BDE02_07G087200 [Populus trichocarpa]
MLFIFICQGLIHQWSSILDLCNNSLNNRHFIMFAHFSYYRIIPLTHFLFRKKHGPLGPSSSKVSFPYSALPHQFSPDDFRTITHTKFWKNQVHPSISSICKLLM